MRIKKAVIPCGGRGVRFLPATRALPKEMLPLVDKPCLDFIVDEAVGAGVEEILIIINSHKCAIKEYFDGDLQLQEFLSAKGCPHFAQLCKRRDDVKLFYTTQFEAKGTGDALMHAQSFCCGEPFLLLFGDDLFLEGNPSKQLIEVFDKTGGCVLGCGAVDKKDLSKYGVLDIESQADQIYKISGVTEKPDPDNAKSNLVSIGRFLFTCDIFEAQQSTPIAPNGEWQQSDAINLLAKSGKVYASELKQKRYDLGNKTGFLRANIEYGLIHPETKKEMQKYIQSLHTI